MSLALAGKAPATFEIKSAQLPLVALLLKSSDLVRLDQELTERFGDVPDFFDHDPLLIDLHALPPAESAGAAGPVPDFPALIALLQRHRLRPVAVKGGDATQQESAVRAGLVPADDALPGRSAASASPAADTASPAPAPVAPAPGALVIDRPLRSGQQVYARGRDLVVLAMVNPGAEVIADGNIHVYAPLRGKAIAGARGDTEARIFTLSMAPELVSIAGVYRTSEVPWPEAMLHKPAQVRLQTGPDGDRLMAEPLSG